MSETQFIDRYLTSKANLPLILAGPILRHTKPRSVTVWLALSEMRSLSLEIYATKDRGETIDRLVITGRRQTIQLSKHLYVVAITAECNEGTLLKPGEIYAYNISSDREKTIYDLQDSDRNLSYFDHQLPTFSLPPADLERLNIVHGSCRKPHGGGKDALACLDGIIEGTANSADERPHQLLMTGDQIYSDDVADPMLWLARAINKLLFGWSEELPLTAGRTILADCLLPGDRCETARVEGGFTSMFRGNEDKAKSHLFSFSEYTAFYLLAWSPKLLPDSFFETVNAIGDRKKSSRWRKEIKAINTFCQQLPAVRRALANIPTYTICDDHEISDDWYLNREWCERVLSKPLGKRVLQNGLLAYAIFQAWGNTPQHFAPGTAGEKLLTLASRWLLSEGKDESAKAECDIYLGIPPNDPNTGLPQLESDGDTLILARDKRVIPWHYQIEQDKHEIIVLDTRNWRGYPPEKTAGLDPPMLLCHQGFAEQLTIPLSQSKPDRELTFVVIPTNLVTLKIIDIVQQFAWSRDRVFSSDVGDSWNFHETAFAKLLLDLCRQRQQVILLSGDIHYSCAVRLTHWFHEPVEASVIVQLTSSAIKNSELVTRLAHTKLKSLFPEKTERWLGWNRPLQLKKIGQFIKTRQQNSGKTNQLPDWQYKIEWCKRQPAIALPEKSTLNKKQKKQHWWQKIARNLINIFWRGRWLQDGSEIIGRNNLSIVKFRRLPQKTIVQETYWHSPWGDRNLVKSRYEVSLESEPLPPLSSRSLKSKV